MLLEAKVEPGDPFFEIIDDAYRAFACPKPKSIEVCENCCMYPHIEVDFFNPPIRELPLEYVRDWYFAAYQPPGVAKETWAYLLPRVLEILATGEEVSSVGFEVSLNRFQTGNRENWTKRQWSVLDRFQRAFLDREFGSQTNALTISSACLGLPDGRSMIFWPRSRQLRMRSWHYAFGTTGSEITRRDARASGLLRSGTTLRPRTISTGPTACIIEWRHWRFEMVSMKTSHRRRSPLRV